MSYPKSSPLGNHDSVQPSPSFPSIEQDVLAFWEKDHTFQASIDQRREQGAPEWVFYDGPPFANGLPHYGHLLTGYAKDTFPRFQTMRGKRVERRFGWDTHGLPAELEAMKQLGMTEKSQILEMGIEKFNAACRESVLKYTREWREYVTRQGRWVDFDNDYKTLNPTFMESVLWAFKQLYDKDLAYEGFRVLPYCWKDQTPLSNHELRMDDDVYKERTDQTVTVSFPLVGEKAEQLGIAGVKALAWTTTPWTLPTNEALAVGPDFEYVVIPAGPTAAMEGEFLLVADRVAAYAEPLGYASADEALAASTQTLRGAQLADVTYQRLFDYFADTAKFGTERAWRILVTDFVTTDDGTGIVHMSPAYGEVDQAACQAAGIPVIVSVDEGAVFLPTVTDFVGLQVFEANSPIIRTIRERGRLFQQKSYAHSYPHCWRCRTPLIYKAVSSWFVKVTDFKDEMGRLNQQINWVPENVKDGQFGKWLSNARDWSISRNRFWGSPIPVWKSDDPNYPRVDVYGSLAELERDFGELPRDEHGEVNLHRPYIDELTRPNPDDPTGASRMRRIPDVFDVWFDSGSMPYAQVHYPFENREWFDTHNPADFIVEYIGQTRGWFYVMHVLGTALFDRIVFRNCVSHGIVLGNDGRKMSKSLRNYPDVNEVFDRDGSDAMRWFLLSSPVLRGGNLIVTEEGIREGVRQLLLPLWSTWYFFSIYANSAQPGGYEAQWRTDSADPLDRYLMAKTGELVSGVQDAFEAFDAGAASAALRDYADILTNWYVRRSRDRFWAGNDTDAFDTLYTALETLCRVAAPILPFVTEEIWQGLTGGRSVHLTDWPDASAFPTDVPLVTGMDRAREIVGAVLPLRKALRLRVRLPLAKLTVVTRYASALQPYASIIADELNVKTVEFSELEPDSAEAYGVVRRLSVNARVAGPRLGRRVQAAIAGARAGDWEVRSPNVIAGGVELLPGEFELVLETGSEHDGEIAVAVLPRNGFVLLDTRVTPELAAEGLARDAIRLIGEARKAAGLEISDRIRLHLRADSAETLAALEAHRDLIAGETLSREFDARIGSVPRNEQTKVGAGGAVAVTVERVSGQE